MAITTAEVNSFVDIGFDLLEGLSDDVTISIKGKKILNKTTNKRETTPDTNITVKGLLQDRTTVLGTGEVVVTQVLLVRNTSSLDNVGTKETVTIGNNKYAISAIARNPYTVEITISGGA